MKDFTSNNELFEYVEKNIISKLDISEKSEIVVNRYSGAKFKLNPTQVALYDYIIGVEIALRKSNDPQMMIFQMSLSVDDQIKMLENYSLSKDYYRTKWPVEYMGLID